MTHQKNNPLTTWLKLCVLGVTVSIGLCHAVEEPDFTEGSGIGGTGLQTEIDVPELPPIIDALDAIDNHDAVNDLPDIITDEVIPPLTDIIEIDEGVEPTEVP